MRVLLHEFGDRLHLGVDAFVELTIDDERCADSGRAHRDTRLVACDDVGCRRNGATVGHQRHGFVARRNGQRRAGQRKGRCERERRGQTGNSETQHE